MIQHSPSYKDYKQIQNTLSKELRKNIALSAFAPTLTSIAEEIESPSPQPSEPSADQFTLKKQDQSEKNL